MCAIFFHFQCLSLDFAVEQTAWSRKKELRLNADISVVSWRLTKKSHKKYLKWQLAEKAWNDGEEVAVRSFHLPCWHLFVHFLRWICDLHLRSVQPPSSWKIINVWHSAKHDASIWVMNFCLPPSNLAKRCWTRPMTWRSNGCVHDVMSWLSHFMHFHHWRQRFWIPSVGDCCKIVWNFFASPGDETALIHGFAEWLKCFWKRLGALIKHSCSLAFSFNARLECGKVYWMFRRNNVT